MGKSSKNKLSRKKDDTQAATDAFEESDDQAKGDSFGFHQRPNAEPFNYPVFDVAGGGNSAIHRPPVLNGAGPQFDSFAPQPIQGRAAGPAIGHSVKRRLGLYEGDDDALDANQRKRSRLATGASPLIGGATMSNTAHVSDTTNVNSGPQWQQSAMLNVFNESLGNTAPTGQSSTVPEYEIRPHVFIAGPDNMSSNPPTRASSLTTGTTPSSFSSVGTPDTNNVGDFSENQVGTGIDWSLAEQMFGAENEPADLRGLIQPNSADLYHDEYDISPPKYRALEDVQIKDIDSDVEEARESNYPSPTGHERSRKRNHDELVSGQGDKGDSSSRKKRMPRSHRV